MTKRTEMGYHLWKEMGLISMAFGQLGSEVCSSEVQTTRIGSFAVKKNPENNFIWVLKFGVQKEKYEIGFYFNLSINYNFMVNL